MKISRKKAKCPSIKGQMLKRVFRLKHGDKQIKFVYKVLFGEELVTIKNHSFVPAY